jgi:hypothetical protein
MLGFSAPRATNSLPRAISVPSVSKMEQQVSGQAAGMYVPELVIFDCDGVLVDSERIAVPIDAFVLSQLGWDLTQEEIIERFVGRSDEFIVSEIEAHLGRRLAPDWEAPFAPLYKAAFEADLRPVDGVVQALDQITVPICVASSGSHEKMRHTLGLVGLYERFADRMFSVSDVTRGKPAPDLFLTPRSAWACAPPHARWSRIAATESKLLAQPACVRSGTPVASPERRRSRGPVRLSSTTCDSCPHSSASAETKVSERPPSGTHGSRMSLTPDGRDVWKFSGWYGLRRGSRRSRTSAARARSDGS